MNKYYITALLALLSFNQGYAQIKDMTAVKNSVFVAAKAMNHALVTNDFETYVESNHPKVFENTPGGKAAMVEQTKEQIARMGEQGNYITAAWPGTPSTVIDTAGEWQCTISQYMDIRLGDGKITTETTLVAISTDKGKKWYFVDATNRGIDALRELFPNLSHKLKALPPPEPKFTPDAKPAKQ